MALLPMWRKETWQNGRNGLSCKSLAICALLCKCNKYKERDREKVQKSSTLIANLIANLIVCVAISDDYM